MPGAEAHFTFFASNSWGWKPHAPSRKVLSGFQNAALLGYAVLADGPVFIGQARLPRLLEDFGEIVGEAEIVTVDLQRLAAASRSSRVSLAPRLMLAPECSGGWSITFP